jgi:hypothetical protein
MPLRCVRNFALMTQHPRSPIRFKRALETRFRSGLFRSCAAVVGAAGTAHVRGMGALFISFPCEPIGRTHGAQVNNRKDFDCGNSTGRTFRRQAAFSKRTPFGESAALPAIIFVNRHGILLYFATERSAPLLIIFFGPSAFGMMSNSKISVGRNTVAQAFGISTIPLMCPSTGAVPRMA